MNKKVKSSIGNIAKENTSKTNPILRTAKLEDLKALEKFQQKLIKLEIPFDSGIPKKYKIQYYDLEKLIKAANTKFFVAEIERKIVGCAFGQIRKSVEWTLDKNYGYIGLMFVDEKFRGRKIGKLIIDSLVKWFKEKNIAGIRLQVYQENVTAVNAYRKYGFKDFFMEMQYDPD